MQAHVTGLGVDASLVLVLMNLLKYQEPCQCHLILIKSGNFDSHLEVTFVIISGESMFINLVGLDLKILKY